MRLAFLAIAACAATLGSLPAAAAGVDKLYVLDCGHIAAPDQSRWSPGVNVGVPIQLSDNCYLIHHAQGWFLWDTGLSDAIAAKPDGVTAPNGMHMTKPKTLIRRSLRRSASSRRTSRRWRCRTPIPTISAMSKNFRRSCSTCRRPNTTGRARAARRGSTRTIR